MRICQYGEVLATCGNANEEETSTFKPSIAPSPAAAVAEAGLPVNEQRPESPGSESGVEE